jgi:starch-binding outer membrane protein, SusD/RagB family
MRWKEGKCIEQEMYGMYFPGPGDYDLDGDGKMDLCIYEGDVKPSTTASQVLKLGVKEGMLLSEGTSGYIDPQQGISHVFDENRDYLYPIPTKDRNLNPNLTQNPGWVDGVDNAE